MARNVAAPSGRPAGMLLIGLSEVALTLCQRVRGSVKEARADIRWPSLRPTDLERFGVGQRHLQRARRCPPSAISLSVIAALNGEG